MPLGPQDVGRRVVVRRRLPDDTGRYADVLGELVVLDADRLTVRRRDGSLTSVAVADVVAGKPVPPPPPERWPDDRTLEEIAALGWQGLVEERLGEWRLRAADGFTGRANSLLPLGDPDRPLAAALAYVEAWYAERGLPPLAQVPLPLAAALDEALAAAGWRAYNPTAVLVGRVDDMVARCPERTDLPPVQHAPTPSEQWLAGYHYRGRELPPGAVRVLANAAAPTFAAVADTDGLLGVARGVVDAGWLGVTALTVTEPARRRGLGTHLMRGLGRWAREQGARRVYLQVAEDNTPALELYDGLGFVRHHRYHYRTRDGRPG